MRDEADDVRLVILSRLRAASMKGPPSGVARQVGEERPREDR